MLKILAKLNDAVDYSGTDIESLSWQQKTKLVQKDPVTPKGSYSRYFDHRVQQFIYSVLKNYHEPHWKVQDFFYRVELQQHSYVSMDRECSKI